MNFIDSINEGVLFSSQLKTTLSQLNSKLEAAKSKILFEINQNWINLNIVHSETLISILHKVIEDNYDLTLEIDNSMDNTLGAFLKKKIYLNLYEIIQDVKIFKILRITGKLTFIDDLFTRIVTTISHELTHYAQEMTRSKKIMERILQKYETQGSKYYDNKDEMMAFAFGIVQSLKYQNYSQEEALQIISLGIDEEGFFPNAELKNYYEMKQLKNWKTFLKYLYDYTQNHWSDL